MHIIGISHSLHLYARIYFFDFKKQVVSFSTFFSWGWFISDLNSQCWLPSIIDSSKVWHFDSKFQLALLAFHPYYSQMRLVIFLLMPMLLPPFLETMLHLQNHVINSDGHKVRIFFDKHNQWCRRIRNWVKMLLSYKYLHQVETM